MRKLENSVIPCSAEINLTGIPTVRNVTEINFTSGTQKFQKETEIPVKTPEIPVKVRKLRVPYKRRPFI